MKKIDLTLCMCLLCTVFINAQTSPLKYRRSSIYSLLINHADQDFGREIRDVFMQMPIDTVKFNDHNLSVRVLELDEKLEDAKKDDENEDVTMFLKENEVASRLVAKWFDRDYYTGECKYDLVLNRSLQGTDTYDKILSKLSGNEDIYLSNIGEELIANTFVVVNDVRYVDKGAKSAVVAIAMSAISDRMANMIESIKGFSVRVNSFLYQLVWDEDTQTEFYNSSYTSEPNQEKRDYFENNRSHYKLKYVGKVESKGSTTSMFGIKLDEPIMMVRKACQRAIDDNLADLQHEFEPFRIKMPLCSTEPIKAYVGLKEGVSVERRYEVLEVLEQENGKVQYKRVGIIQPIESLIWDNRYMAEEEHAKNATLGATTFKKISGGNFTEGMLIREIK